MGWAAGLKLREAVDGLRRVLAIQLLVASRALDLRAPLRAAAGTGAAVQTLREAGVPGPGPDVMVGDQIDRVVSLLESRAVLASVNAQIGDLD